jgi:proteasome lid subunit RPN8/RPN11
MTKKASPKAPPQADEPKPEPQRTAEEQALVEAWQTQPRLQRPPRLKDGEAPGTVVPDTADLPLWAARVAQALGVDDPWLIDMLMNQAANCLPGAPAKAASVAVAAVQSLGPRDGIEAMLAVQMAATHAVAMKMLQRATVEQPSIEVYDSLVNRATKLLRTYTMQVEALKRHRSAGEQRVVVQHQHVNVTADRAAVQVNGAAPDPGGRGAASKLEERSHAQGEPVSLAHAPEPTVPGPDPAGDGLPAAGGEREGAVPHAWRR